ncbi:MAG TPA: LON peptidase substrate-binding domain-containing protein [Ignavibacteriaceae bacterium]|nr:LON peptidase substrate-binding domain-containing protein [Ignavibacteriaceae bacterium]
MNQIIPIFPLALVVFPNSKYPLHIFEERYKILINKCLGNSTGFGIVSKIGDTVSEVGVYVEIVQVIKIYESGELDIVVAGKWRFKRMNIEMHPDGYYLSDVSRIKDNESEGDLNFNLFFTLKQRVQEMLKLVNFNVNQGFWDNLEKTNLKSFKIAEKSGLSILQQQELLTIQSENKRLSYLLDHFEKLEAKLEENKMMREIILGDGYLN